MTNDLVKRLRCWPQSVAGDTMKEAADRIEELEAKLSDAVAYLERVGEVSSNVLAEAFGPDADLHYASAIITQLKGENQ